MPIMVGLIRAIRDNEEICEVFPEETGEEEEVSLDSLRTTHQSLRSLLKSSGMLGLRALQRTIEIGALIEKRHKESQSSLDAILSTPQRR